MLVSVVAALLSASSLVPSMPQEGQGKSSSEELTPASQSEESLYDPIQVLRVLLASGKGTAGGVDFKSGELARICQKCDLVKELTQLTEGNDFEWARRGYHRDIEQARKEVFLSAFAILSAYRGHSADARIDDYFKKVALDKSREVWMRRDAATRFAPASISRLAVFYAEVLRNHPEIAAPMVSILDHLAHAEEPFVNPADLYTPEVREALRSYILQGPKGTSKYWTYNQQRESELIQDLDRRAGYEQESQKSSSKSTAMPRGSANPESHSKPMVVQRPGSSQVGSEKPSRWGAIATTVIILATLAALFIGLVRRK